MVSFRSLRRWLGPAVDVKTSAAGVRFRCERLEDRFVPAGLTLTPVTPTTTTDFAAQIRSTRPLTDFANLVNFLNLGGSVDLATSTVALSTGDTALLDVRLKPNANAAAVMASLRSFGNFDWVSPNYSYAGTPGTATDLREFAPNDPKFPDQYHHALIGTPSAWDRTLGSPTVITALLDDGIDLTHPDLKDAIWSNPREIPGDNIDNDGNGFIDDIRGWDFVHNTNDVRPDDPSIDRHGTQVAGLLAGRIDNGTGIAGVAGRSSILPLKVVGNAPTNSLAFARAVGYAVANGARIINNSLNVDPFVNDPIFKAAVTFAYNRGVLWINSAGNSNVMDPARQQFEEMLLVAATDRNDQKAGYSNYGRGIDIAAPGGTQTDGLITTDTKGGYTAAFGTSMAAPLVSGTAALIWSLNPSLTRDQVASLLLGTADDITSRNSSFMDLLGAGRVNADRATAGTNFVTRFDKLTGLPAQNQSGEGVSKFALRLHSPLEPSTVTADNFELRSAGADNVLGTGDDQLVPLTINDNRPYRIGTNELEFTVGRALTRGLYRFTAKSGGLTDPFGRPVDGDGDGTSGGNLVRVFGIDYQVSGTLFDDTQNSGFYASTDPGVPSQTVFADINGNGVLDRSTFTSNFPPLTIPEQGANAARMPVVVSGLADPAGAITVSVLVSHPDVSDLTISLVSPGGERIVLVRNRVLPRVVNGERTLFVFADGIEESTTPTPTLVTHRLNPLDSLGRFRGRDANGTWFVEVSDNTPGDRGTLLDASLSITTEPTAISDANGTFTLTGLPSVDTVALLVEPSAGWKRSGQGGAVPVAFKDRTGTGPTPMPTIGLVRTHAIYGRVFRDIDNGQFGPNDPGLGGVTVYADRNGNGRLDDGEPCAVSDASGNYVLPDLSPGGATVREQTPLGFVRLSPATRNVVLTPDASSFGNDFLYRLDAAPVRLTVAGVAPKVRNAPVDSVDLTLSEPIPGFGPSNFLLTRDGREVPLNGTTLAVNGNRYTLLGLRDLTSAEGVYALTVTPPAPGNPGRIPPATTIDWTNDATPPTAAVATMSTLGVTSARVNFSEPVNGFSLANVVFTRDGVPLSLADVALSGTGANYTLANLGPLTREPGTYVLEVRPVPAVLDAAGNAMASFGRVGFKVDRPLPPPPPPPTAPPGLRTAVGPGPTSGPFVNVYAAGTGKLLYTIVAYDLGFTGGVRVATADLNGDGVEDIITVPGPGGGPRVRTFDGTDGHALGDFMAFEPNFTGGAYVVVGDLNNDGTPDIVVTPDEGGGPRVQVFDGKTDAPFLDFFGIDDANFRGGARATVGDLNADGTPDLIVAAGFGGGPRVAIYDGHTLASGNPRRLVPDFFAFEDSLRNGIYLSAGDVNGDGFADLVCGGGPSGGPRVTIFSGKELAERGLLAPLANFFAANPDNRTGIRVLAKDIDGDGRADLLTAAGQGATVRRYASDSLLTQDDPMFSEFDAFRSFTGGVFVG